MIKDHVIKDLTCPSCKRQGEFESVGRLYCKPHFEETIQKIEAEKPDILGLSALTRRVYALNEILKKTSA